jgi:hypothetical protein
MGTYRVSDQAHDWVGYAIAKALHLDIQNPADKRRVKLTQKDLVKSGRLRREERKDFTGKPRPFIVSGVPMVVDYDNGEDLV